MTRVRLAAYARRVHAITKANPFRKERMMRKIWMRTVVIAGLAVVVGMQGRAQNLISIDATAPMVAPQPVAAKLGSSRNPRGHVIGINSQYLTLDGKPW